MAERRAPKARHEGILGAAPSVLFCILSLTPALRGCLTIDVFVKIAPASYLFSIRDFAKNQPLDSLLRPG